MNAAKLLLTFIFVSLVVSRAQDVVVILIFKTTVRNKLGKVYYLCKLVV
jgi:hypothetical protein